jgi:hypothetical protein
MSANPTDALAAAVAVRHIVKGELLTGTAPLFGVPGAQFATPRLDLNTLVWPRTEPGPAFHVPVAEIIDLLVATGQRMTLDPDGILAQACEQMKRSSPLDGGVPHAIVLFCLGRVHKPAVLDECSCAVVPTVVCQNSH